MKKSTDATTTTVPEETALATRSGTLRTTKPKENAPAEKTAKTRRTERAAGKGGRKSRL